MTVHCIHLTRREDRLISITKQAEEQNFELQLWEGIYDKHYPKRGICMSHKKIIRYAREEKLPYIICMEDDCRFSATGAFDYYIKNMPEDFQLYCGCLYAGEIDSERRIKNGMSASHTLITVHSSFYDFVLSMPDNEHIDRYAGAQAFKYKYYLPPKFVCYQMNNFSDNLKKHMIYDRYHEKMEFYEG
jgi:hypothetical protein